MNQEAIVIEQVCSLNIQVLGAGEGNINISLLQIGGIRTGKFSDLGLCILHLLKAWVPRNRAHISDLWKYASVLFDHVCHWTDQNYLKNMQKVDSSNTLNVS